MLVTAEQYGEMYERLHAKLKNIAWRIVGGDAADDAVQDVFLYVWKRMAENTWRWTLDDKLFCLMVRQRAIILLRMSKCRLMTEAQFLDDNGGGMGGEYDPARLRDASYQVPFEFEVNTTRDIESDVAWAIAQLKPADQAIIRDIYFDGLTIVDAAKKRGCSKQNIHARLKVQQKAGSPIFSKLRRSLAAYA